MRPRLREILLLVATAGVSAVSTTACSAPASEGVLARTQTDPKMASSLAAHGASPAGGDEQKARLAQTPKEPRGDELRGRCPRSMA